MTYEFDQIVYFPDEGRAHLEACLDLAFTTAATRGIKKIVIFTARGDGISLAIEKRKETASYEALKLVGVSFPQGQMFTDPKDPKEKIAVDISAASRNAFRKAKVPIIRAHLPFDSIAARFSSHGVLGQDSSLIGNALSIFGGGMSLCVQATLISCDAGQVMWGEHVIAMTADTAILVQAAPTSRFLTDLVVREILCKPLFLTIGKKERTPQSLARAANSDGANVPEPKLLPPG